MSQKIGEIWTTIETIEDATSHNDPTSESIDTGEAPINYGQLLSKTTRTYILTQLSLRKYVNSEHSATAITTQRRVKYENRFRSLSIYAKLVYFLYHQHKTPSIPLDIILNMAA